MENKLFNPVSKILNMAKRRIIKGKCYFVRERNTVSGRKGTIMGKCKTKPRKKPRRIVRKSLIKKLFD